MGDNVNSTSFASILAGVRKLRQDAEGGEPPAPETSSVSSSSVSRDSTKEAPQPISSDPANVRLQPQRIISNRMGPASNMAVRHGENARTREFSTIQVSKHQRGNPMLDHLRDVGWTYNESVKKVDYLVNSKLVVIYLSLKYHKLHPEYIYNKIKGLGSTGNTQALKVLLVVVDIENTNDIVRELNKVCLFNDLSLLLAWSNEEASRFLTFLKMHEFNIHTSTIRGNTSKDQFESLSSIRTINKTNSKDLLRKYGSLQNLMVHATDEEELGAISGMGQVKVKKLLRVLDEPFIYNLDYDKLSHG
ncbi:unnamed protein product [Kuraishia capsulata CBS 1993]|uniref:ERCC1-like central domain-containing protein n=1 Tax=Kuraishia capsulata CBS 1993 TaxID=1382522 RepID=W6MY48_9ASCO|nr:uncharacterized protein KUCA_T00006005001 [Kuraishia capsulata CBS 1993]CDK30010.1 unnamed protein product [Kuraishia capsulata CBS 1993]